MKLTIREYLTAQGKNPFRDWLKSLDISVQARIQARVLRFETVIWAITKPSAMASGKHVWISDPGIGCTLEKAGISMILLLVGGDKGSQSKDIALAKRYWQDFRDGGET